MYRVRQLQPFPTFSFELEKAFWLLQNARTLMGEFAVIANVEERIQVLEKR